MKLWKVAVFVLFAGADCGAWSHDQTQAPANNKSVDNIGLQVANSDKRSEGQSESSSAANRSAPTPAARARATAAIPETSVSPKEAKELFRSVDEILQFASQDTGLPSKQQGEAQAGQPRRGAVLPREEHEGGQRCEAAGEIGAVLKKFGCCREIRPVQLFGGDVARTGGGLLRRENENRELAELAGHRPAETVLATSNACSTGPVVWHREVDEGSAETVIREKMIQARPILKNDEESSAPAGGRGRAGDVCCSTIRWRRPARRC